MFQPDPADFPGNIIIVLAEYFSRLDAEVPVVQRPVNTDDDMQTIGVFATDWEPDNNSYEIQAAQAQHMMQPTMASYQIIIQGLVTDTDQVRGIATHSALAKRIRLAVAGDEGLRLSLGALTSPFGQAPSGQPRTERVLRWSVPRQEYLVNELQGTWLYLSNTEFRLTTNTS